MITPQDEFGDSLLGVELTLLFPFNRELRLVRLYLASTRMVFILFLFSFRDIAALTLPRVLCSTVRLLPSSSHTHTSYHCGLAPSALYPCTWEGVRFAERSVECMCPYDRRSSDPSHSYVSALVCAKTIYMRVPHNPPSQY